MKKLLLAVAGLAVLAGSQAQAKKVCDMIEKFPAQVHEGQVYPATCATEQVVTCPGCPEVVCPSVTCPACMCEAPKKVTCDCTPSIKVQEECHEVCTSCHQLKADCGCGRGGHRHGHRHGRRAANVVYAD